MSRYTPNRFATGLMQIALAGFCRGMFAVVSLLLVTGSAAFGQTDLPADVGDAFGLDGGQLIAIDLGAIVDRRGQANAMIDGSEYTLELRPIPSGLIILFFVSNCQVERTLKGSLMLNVPSRVRSRE